MKLLLILFILFQIIVGNDNKPKIIRSDNDIITFRASEPVKCDKSLCLLSHKNEDNIPGTYICDCKDKNVHPNCNCDNKCDCKKHGPINVHPSCPCSIHQNIIPINHMQQCLPNIAGVQPSSCGFQPTNYHCQLANSNCSPLSSSRDQKKNTNSYDIKLDDILDNINKLAISNVSSTHKDDHEKQKKREEDEMKAKLLKTIKNGTLAKLVDNEEPSVSNALGHLIHSTGASVNSSSNTTNNNSISNSQCNTCEKCMKNTSCSHVEKCQCNTLDACNNNILCKCNPACNCEIIENCDKPQCRDHDFCRFRSSMQPLQRRSRSVANVNAHHIDNNPKGNQLLSFTKIPQLKLQQKRLSIARMKVSEEAEKLKNANDLIKSLHERANSNCEVGPFTPWSSCNATCGYGISQRSRNVTIFPTGNGRICPTLVQYKRCIIKPCEEDCKLGNWSPWSQCSATCGNGVKSRMRQIITNAKNGGKPCPSNDLLTQQVKCKIKDCPLNCQLGNWTAYGPCSVTCGKGSKTRTRRIIKAPKFNGTACGATIDTESCGVPCPIDCQVSPWEQWSKCSVTCGSGVKTRNRQMIVEAQFGGKTCGPLQEHQACNLPSCTRDCQLSEWSEWSQCSRSCAGGVRRRTRMIVASPLNGGAACDILSDSEPCNEIPCPSQHETQQERMDEERMKAEERRRMQEEDEEHLKQSHREQLQQLQQWEKDNSDQYSIPPPQQPSSPPSPNNQPPPPNNQPPPPNNQPPPPNNQPPPPNNQPPPPNNQPPPPIDNNHQQPPSPPPTLNRLRQLNAKKMYNIYDKQSHPHPPKFKQVTPIRSLADKREAQFRKLMRKKR